MIMIMGNEGSVGIGRGSSIKGLLRSCSRLSAFGIFHRNHRNNKLQGLTSIQSAKGFDFISWAQQLVSLEPTTT